MILTELVFFPLAGALLILMIPRQRVWLIKFTAMIVTAAVLVLSAIMLCHFDFSRTGLQFVEYQSWIPQMRVWYFLGVDGINMALVFLTALLGFLSCAASWRVNDKPKGYFILYLLLMTGVMGTFVSLDLFLFYIFWELVLIPIYFLIAIWGGPGRESASMKFFLYTLAGSVFMLLGILGVYFAVVPHTFDMLVLSQLVPRLDVHMQVLLFIGFYLAFAVKLPIFPFHTWLPEAYAEAPTPVTMLMAGLLAKMGGYGLVRICFPFFKSAAHSFAVPLAILGALTIVYAAMIAVSQKDFKRMVAYASVSHMGFVVLALAAMNQTGFNGALLEMFNHGIIIAGLFFLAAALHLRSGTRQLSQFGGLWGQMPVFGFFLMMCALATLGLPGLNGFVSEFLSLLGAYAVFPTLTVMASLGLIVTAAYVLFMVGNVLLGPVTASGSKYTDLTVTEIFILTPLVGIIVAVGFCPMLVLRFQETAVAALTGLM